MPRSRWLPAADLRCVGLFRITFGLVMLSEIADFAPFLRVGLSDEGFWPRSVALAGDVGRFSLMDVSGPPWVAYGYWSLALAACICFIVGWHSRLATAATLVLATGMMERNPFICDYSDQVIRVLLFWSLFLPVGNWYSIDAAMARSKGRPLAREGSALEIHLIGLQVGWIYLSTFLYKLPGVAWRNGTAVHFALGNEHDYARALGSLLRSMPWVTTAATYLTLAIEGAFLPLAFMPFWQPQARALALLTGAAMHVGIWLTMCVGEFSWLMISSYTLLFEPSWVDWTIARALGVGQWLRRRVGWASPTSDWFAVVAPLDDRELRGANASSPAVRSAPVPTRIVRWGLWAGRSVLAALFAACVWTSAPIPERFAAPNVLQTIVRNIEAWQCWAMFAPNPSFADVELMGDGKLLDGTPVDVLRGDTPAGPLPPSKHKFFASRWTDASNYIRFADPPLIEEFAHFLCRHWNRDDRPSRRPLLATLRLSRVERAIHEKDTGLDAPQVFVLWYQACFDASKNPEATKRPAAP